ncbi:hypothetical protein GCM10029976_056260 [Kribbella albertanoniae]
MGDRVTAGEFHSAEGVEDWRSVYHLVSAHFRTGSLAEGTAFVGALEPVVGEAAEYLAVDLRAAGVTVSLAGGMWGWLGGSPGWRRSLGCGPTRLWCRSSM